MTGLLGALVAAIELFDALSGNSTSSAWRVVHAEQVTQAATVGI